MADKKRPASLQGSVSGKGPGELRPLPCCPCGGRVGSGSESLRPALLTQFLTIPGGLQGEVTHHVLGGDQNSLPSPSALFFLFIPRLLKDTFCTSPCMFTFPHRLFNPPCLL